MSTPVSQGSDSETTLRIPRGTSAQPALSWAGALRGLPQQLQSLQEFLLSPDGGRMAGCACAVTVLLLTMTSDPLPQLLCLATGAFLLWFVQTAPEKKFFRAGGKALQKQSQRVVSVTKRGVVKDEKLTSRCNRGDGMDKARLPKPEELDTGGAASRPLLLLGENIEEDCASLLNRMKVTPQSKHIMDSLGVFIQQTIEEIFPGVGIVGYSQVNVQDTHSRCSVAPEIDFVAQMTTESMFRYICSRCTQKQIDSIQQAKDNGTLSAAKLQKSGLRACAELLSQKGFGFIGSQFRGNEIKVTMMTTGKQTVFFDLKINSPVPAFVEVLIKICEELQPRSRELIMLVRRWAICRKLCHASRGYHPLYHWTLMVVHFLQVRTAGSLLPPLKCYGGKGNTPLGLRPATSTVALESISAREDITPIGELFGEFMRFYASEFDWQTEVIAIQGCRRGHFPSWPVQVVKKEDGVQCASALNIADPFNYGRSLRTSATWESVKTLREELMRAGELVGSSHAGSGVLAEILEVYPGSRWHRHTQQFAGASPGPGTEWHEHDGDDE